ncbi:sugar ABC transporter substrate-binding protein [Limnochorda pilosa]|uniref:Sugar ABC transporter substrate-binding protein n=1 Tax=Limnochorda pilosa TaxID=1555112 RepID=A0A0K2SMA9_LIMPI|nr:sugar ABC transporter substrate-binding protein [Limnochorda pilosa]
MRISRVTAGLTVAFLVLVLGLAAGSAQAQKTIELWHIFTNENEQAVLDEAVERFRAVYPDVDVKVTVTDNDTYKTKLQVAMAAGSPPDVFHSWGGGWLEEYVDAGMVLPLTGALERDRWGETFVPASLGLAKYGEDYYAVPLTLAVVVFFYNQAIFEEHGWETPETWSELLTLVDAMRNEGIIPISIANKTKWPGAFYLIYLAHRVGGAEVFEKAYNREPGYGFDHPAFVEAGERIQELVRAGAFPVGFNGLDHDVGQASALMYSGRAAMHLMGSWFPGQAREEDPEFARRLGWFPFPRLEDGKGDPTEVVAGGDLFSVASTTDYPEEAVALARYLTAYETAVDWTRATGRLPAVVNVPVEDPMTAELMKLLEEAAHLQLYYDQFLPPELGELHKDTTQAIFGLSMTPLEAAQAMERKAQELLGR